MKRDTQFDDGRYETAQTYLKAAFEHMVAAGRSARDFSGFALHKFGDSFLPYLRQFYDDVGNGRIKIVGLTRTEKSAILGRQQISPQAREEMIRVAAYLRAEQRGFTGGSAADDWYAAEREIDKQLVTEADLATKEHKVLASAAAIMEKELGNIKKSIAAWLETAGEAAPKAKKSAPRKKSRETVS